ncbi:MAG: hypothetical protein EOP56_13865 [Sphingobacteriales bacterium]|nr:MAG: hypothetical protein EOP56_13865 [Sphingobacteriales bacterium]
MKKIIFVAAIVGLASCGSSTKEGYSSTDTVALNRNERSTEMNGRTQPGDRRNTDSTVNDVINDQVRDSNMNGNNMNRNNR